MRHNMDTTALQQLMVLVHVGMVSAYVVDTNPLVEKLETIMQDAFGTNTMQEYFTSHTIATQYTHDGVALAKKYASEISELVATRSESLRQLKTHLVTWYTMNAFTDQPQSQACCEADMPEEADAMFKTRVKRGELCYRKSAFTPSGELHVHAPLTLRLEFEAISEAWPGLKWQTYSTELGMQFQYPSSRAHSCKDYDPRFSPSYTKTASPAPRDVVLVISESPGMGDYVSNAGGVIPRGSGSSGSSRTIMQVAIEAGQTLIDSLGPTDRVGVLGFSSYAHYPLIYAKYGMDCFYERLGLAVPRNKALLKTFLADMHPRVTGNSYEQGVQGAFSLLEETPADPQYNRIRVIMFVTAEATDDGDISDLENFILSKISQYDINHPDSPTTLYTFGIGNADHLVLQRMTAAAHNPPGKSVVIHDINKLPEALVRYYTHLPQEDAADVPIISLPHYDPNGLGMVLKMTLPVHANAQLMGVVSFDLSLTEIMAAAVFADKTFVMDIYTGYVLTHPLLPRPYAVTQEPGLVRLVNLDDSEGILAMNSSLIEGHSGFHIFQRTAHAPLGEYFRGTIGHTVSSTYSWAKVAGTTWAVGVMYDHHAKGDSTVKVTRPYFSTVPYTYHEEVEWASYACRHFNTRALKDRSVVKFGPSAFRDPFKYLETDIRDDIFWISNLDAEVREKGQVPPMLKPEAVNDVYVTAQIHTAWFNDLSPPVPYAVRRYAATPHGVMRVTPGVTLHRHYDPAHRPWYLRALAVQGALAVSAPYLDMWGAGYIVTISQAMYPAKDASQEAQLVVGIDLPIAYVYQLMNSSLPVCHDTDTACALVDSQGYVVMHDTFIKFDEHSLEPLVENNHVTKAEDLLADRLLRLDYLVHQVCHQPDTLQAMHHYKTSDFGSGDGITELHSIPRTNLHVAVHQPIERTRRSPSCPCTHLPATTPVNCSQTYHSFLGYSCYCPCFNNYTYEYCTNSVSPTDNNGHSLQPPCTPPADPVDMTLDVLHNYNLTLQLEECFELKCSNNKNDNACRSVAGCNWCTQFIDGEDLNKPYCDRLENCYFGRKLYPSPYGIELPPPVAGKSSTYIIVGVVLAIVAIIIALIAAKVIYKKYKSDRITDVPVSTTADAAPWRSSLTPTAPPSGYIPSAGPSITTDSGPPSYSQVQIKPTNNRQILLPLDTYPTPTEALRDDTLTNSPHDQTDTMSESSQESVTLTNSPHVVTLDQTDTMSESTDEESFTDDVTTFSGGAHSYDGHGTSKLPPPSYEEAMANCTHVTRH